VNAVVDLLRAAALAGHTVLPRAIVLRSCGEQDARAAVSAGEVIDVEWHGDPAWALTDVAESEELLADGLTALAQENRLAVVVGPESAARRATLATALGQGVTSTVLDDAHTVGLDEALAAVEDLPEGDVLALSLDQALPLGDVLGAVALDLAASGVCPVLRSDGPRPVTALARARVAVASGRWSPPVSEDRSFVLVDASTPDEALHRVGQLVSTSIPRAFGTSPGQIAVLTLDDSGPVGRIAVESVLAGAGVAVPVAGIVASTEQRWSAVVAVLPGMLSPALTRAVVYAVLRSGTEHVSIVHGFGAEAAALAEAVAGTTDRPRRTRLTALLTS
jgi:hypothetical protein